MIEIIQYSRELNYDGYDYVIEETDTLSGLVPYLLPKIEGGWEILLLTPPLSYVRSCLDTPLIPSHIHLVLVVDKQQLKQLYLERPALADSIQTNWEVYRGLLADFPTPLTPKAMREIYYRAGPKRTDLHDALQLLSQYQAIGMREVNKHFAPVQRVYARQVVRAFLLGETKESWKLLQQLESSIGSTVCFYAMRKYVRTLMSDKVQYLNNQDTQNRLVEEVDGYTLTLLYWHLESISSPYQLHPFLYNFERRNSPCLLQAKHDMFQLPLTW